MQGEPERSRDPVGGIPGRVGDSSLEPSHGCRVDVRSVGYSLLAEPDLLAAETDRASEGDLRGMAYTHI